MFKQIVIIEKSKIIREGLAGILHAHEISKKVISIEDFSEWGMTVKNLTPNIIILSPEKAQEGADKIRSKYQLPGNTLLVGIVYQYYNIREITEIFDEILFITDPEDLIINKLKNLSKQAENNNTASNEKLTDREKDVLKLLLRGLSNKEVAEQLSISPHTVVTHRKNIIEKTGIRSLSGLAVYAILNNITDMDDLKQ